MIVTNKAIDCDYSRLRVIPAGNREGEKIQTKSKIRVIAEKAFAGIALVAKTVQRFVPFIGLATIVAAPLHIGKALSHCREMDEKSSVERVDSVLDAIDNIEKVGQAGGSFVTALYQIGAVALKVFNWFAGFSVAMSVLSIPSIIRNIRVHRAANQLLVDFSRIENECKGDQLRAFKAIYQHLGEQQEKRRNFVEMTFLHDPTKLADTLIDIEVMAVEMLSSENEEVKEEGKQLLERSIGALKGRISSRLNSASLSILASIVAIVGTVILFATSSISFGMSVMALGGVLSFAGWLENKEADHVMYREMGVKKSAFQVLFS